MFTKNTEELAQNKLLLLYIMKMSPNSFTNSEITEFILEKNYMNYFLIQQYLLELVESKFIDIDKEEEKYLLLEKGILTLDYFEYKIPENLKEELKIDFNSQKELNKIETQVLTEYFEKETGQYNVNIKLVENEETLFSLYIDVATVSQAEIICNTWKTKTDMIYQNIINMLIE